MDQDLEKAFIGTDYVANLPNDATTVIRIGGVHAELDAWVRDYGLQTWCFITAWNPGAEVRERRENARSNVALFMDLQGDGHPAVSATATARDGSWPPEPGFVVVGVSASEALAYAKRFGQRAVVYGELDEAAVLLWAND